MSPTKTVKPARTAKAKSPRRSAELERLAELLLYRFEDGEEDAIETAAAEWLADQAIRDAMGE